MLIKGLSLPPEIIDMIIDEAEYWPCTETSIEFSSATRPRINGNGTENLLLIRSPPIGFTQADVQATEEWRTTPPSDSPSNEPISPEHFKAHLRAIPLLDRPVRKVVFKIRSRDQAWGGAREHHHTFHGSWTWFEAGLERFETPNGDDQQNITRPFDAAALRPVYPTGEVVTRPNGETKINYPLNPCEMHTIQRNRTAAREMVDYEVTWRATDDINPESPEADRLDDMGRGKASGTGEFVRNLRLGDVVSVWGMARFLGWANNVEKASVQVYWAL
ncbi:hypothetical protein F5X68DRAFT_211019 [Plectosphaerella plurivora]|uniref:Ankyrin repeat protein n=1 Tax=Plectosphaerella plurivora TaxID=936078 RepID=A0A9P9AA10_9PEZI|nr:hypothetical protein F5X68DRAFT_211019 [Plectosphaerella plurivora]